ncbi:hypothetical protein FA95DRAFT_1557025 [Auriscalpium vulgare]|uniref:Uncharacterized protein n=1 Tax=Auriscalpium vulgare TaxID=40419 RepID=A0ACB8S0I7_9AGAM|nr:hypothetical protein FA95DRAFT_1557025 [Auriscalpium vulgare]
MPLPVFPVPLSSSEVSRKSANVSHVLSGTPGHAGFTWRPGGPLFPTSFNGSGSALSPYERDSLAELPGRTLITDNPVLSSKNKPVTKPRSRSRPGGLHSLTSRSAHVPAVPPNSPDVHRL